MKRKSIPQTNQPEKVLFNYANAIAKANLSLEALKDRLSAADVPVFGAQVGNEPPAVVFDSLVINRVVKKFSLQDGSRDCRLKAFTNYKMYEDSLPCESNLLNHVYWRKVKLRLMKMLKGFEFNVTNDVEFTPGESYISAGGEVSIIAKLADLTHWTTTWNCLALTLELIWSQPSLKTMARLHIDEKISSHERKRLWQVYSYVPEKDRAKYIFFLLLKKFVLTIVDGARASSVPKNTDTDRFINVEATFPVILQRMCSKQLKKCLKRFGNNLSNVRALRAPGCQQSMSAQELHGWLIQNSWNSTIDFSNASDSVLVWVVSQLFPIKVSSLLFDLRSHFVDFGDDDLVEPKKLSSMGNGFTFEVMTCLLYAMSQEFDSNSRVYGDDVIINSKYANAFKEKCALVGFVVNESKTFINTKFRESCGYFYHDDFGYLTTFDMHKCKTYADVIVAHNKLVVTLEYAPKGSTIAASLNTTIEELRLIANASHFGPVPTNLNSCLKYLACYMFHDNWKRKHKNNKARRALYVYHIEQCKHFFSRQQISTKNVVVVDVPVFVPALSRVKRHQRATFIASLYSGRYVKASVRGKGKWVNIPCFAFDDGFTIPVRDARRNTQTAVFHDILRPLGYKEGNRRRN